MGWRRRLPVGFTLMPSASPFFFGQVGDGGAAGRKRLEAGIVDAGMIEGRQVAGVGAFEANQAGDGLRRRHLRERLDFLRRAAESGALQQMRGEIVIPIRGADGREIVLPFGCRGGLGGHCQDKRRQGSPEKHSSKHNSGSSRYYQENGPAKLMSGGGEVGCVFSGLLGSCVNNYFFRIWIAGRLHFGGIH